LSQSSSAFLLSDALTPRYFRPLSRHIAADIITFARPPLLMLAAFSFLLPLSIAPAYAGFRIASCRFLRHIAATYAAEAGHIFFASHFISNAFH